MRCRLGPRAARARTSCRKATPFMANILENLEIREKVEASSEAPGTLARPPVRNFPCFRERVWVLAAAKQ